MGGMPYLFEKGRIGSLSDDRYTRASPERRIEWLNQLQGASGNLLEPDGVTRSPLVSDTGTWSSLPDDPPGANNVAHLNQDWLGLELTTSPGVWRRTSSNTTGWWTSWSGDAHEIFRCGLVATLEASLGVAHRDRPATYSIAEVERHWPIEVFWTCPSPKLEITVTWKDHVSWVSLLPVGTRRALNLFSGGGQVTMILSTPGWYFQSQLSSLLDSGTLIHASDPNFLRHQPASPLTTNHSRGLWVIGSNVKVIPDPLAEFYPVGDGLDPNAPSVVANGPVMIVRPAEVDGGVLNVGRTHPTP